MHNDLSCQELAELVNDYLENTMDSVLRARLEAHIEACLGCERYLEQMQQTIGAIGRLTEEGMAPAMRDRLLQLFRDWTLPNSAPTTPRNRPSC